MPLLQVQLICSVGYALIVKTAVMNLISSPLSSQDTFFYGFPALEEMVCGFHVCVRLCARSPALLQLAHGESSFLPSLWHEEDTVLLCAILGTSAVGKGSNLEGVPVKSGAGTRDASGQTQQRGLFGLLWRLNCCLHSGDYRGDRARLALRMPRERTRASSCRFLQGKLWPHSREKGPITA